MTTVTKKQLADALEEELIAARDAYHTDGTSPLSDEEYDRKLLLLKPLRPNSVLFTQVGAPVASGTLVKHVMPIGSQEKLKDIEELAGWDKKVPVSKGCSKYAVQWKLDGLTIVATYKKGQLVHAVTRGDGRQGEDVTRNVRYMQNVKARLKTEFTGFLRGELLLPISAFEQHFKPLGFKNPRNTAAGKTRDLKADPNLLKHFEISWFEAFFDDESESPATVEGAMEAIEQMGLEATNTFFVDTVDDVWGCYQTMAKSRATNDFEADGVVVKLNSLAAQRELGMSSSLCPHGQRCIKFTAASNLTKVIGVTHSLGHTGEIFPTASLEAVEINGVTIRSCTLHNYEEVKRLDVAVGDEVEVIRAGDVIPKIVRMTAKGKDREPILAPKKCPACGSKTKVEGLHVFCRALSCPGRAVRLIKTWVKKREIKWLGEEVVDALYDCGLVKSVPDLYVLSRDQLAKLSLSERVVGNGADRIMEELEKSKQCSVSDFMGSLGIDGLGRREAQIMCESCDLETVDDFLTITTERLLQANGYGEVKVKKILEGIAAVKPLIEEMLKVITITQEPLEEKPTVAKTATTKATGKTFCFTGALPSGQTRSDATADLEAAGGIAWDSVKKGLDYLVIADPKSTSSKAKKARELGVNVIDEGTFRSMLK